MLLVVCINVSNAFLLQTIERTGEIAIFEALGASRYHIIKQVFTNSVMLSVPGGILGFFVAIWLRYLLIPLSPVELPRVQGEHEISVIIFSALAASAFTAIACTLPAAVQAAKVAGTAHLRERQGTSGHFAASRFRSVLLVAGIAVAMALGASGALLVKSFWKIRTEELGFQSRGVLRVGVNLPTHHYQEPH
ncbi:MAG: FtsX-like permease family protein, partial [Chloroflexi bacterium]|nr:FtsX-like permease family protein [Chloroflexota bacterium]